MLKAKDKKGFAMDLRRLVKASFAAVFAVALVGNAFGGSGRARAQPAASEQRPNIILIMTDDQGYGDFGVAGNPAVETPNLNALAARSARMTQFYVSPVCAPTRASLMTGRYNYRTRVVDTYLGRAMMEPKETTVAEALAEAGYATGIFGKWHLGDNYPLRPQDQGFEEVLVHRGGGIGQPSDPPGAEGQYTDPILFRNGEKEQMDGYVTDLYFEEAMRWAEGVHEEGQPFFAYISTNAPHAPFDDVPQELYERYSARDLGGASPQHAGVDVGAGEENLDTLARIFAMITDIDQNVGRLFDWLGAQGLTRRTMVVFLTDNGPNTRRYVAGMRGKKSEVYEGGIRSPLWIHWPGQLEAGRTSGRIAAHIDVMPTLLEAAGAPRPDSLEMDGRSLLPLLQGARPPDWPDRRLFIQAHRGNVPVPYHNVAVRSRRWKLVSPSGFQETDLPAEGPDFELYDMRRDPMETEDRSEERPEVVAQLRTAYDRWFDDVSHTRPDNFAPPRITVGTAQENPVVLTRQDWRHESGRPWGRNSQGHWLLRVESAGPYDVRFRLQGESEGGGTALLKAGEKTYREPLEEGARGVTFEAVELPHGEVRLDAVLRQEGQTRGPHQVVLMLLK